MLEINKNPDYKSEPPILRSNSNLELESLNLSVLSILLTAKFPARIVISGFNQSRKFARRYFSRNEGKIIRFETGNHLGGLIGVDTADVHIYSHFQLAAWFIIIDSTRLACNEIVLEFGSTFVPTLPCGGPGRARTTDVEIQSNW